MIEESWKSEIQEKQVKYLHYFGENKNKQK